MPKPDTTRRAIYPRWYRGRTTHIHQKTFIDDRNVLTSQIYFPDALSQYIYDNVAPYSQRTNERDTLNATDRPLAGAGEGVHAAVREAGERYVAAIVIGMNPEAVSQGAITVDQHAGGPAARGSEPEGAPVQEGGGHGAPAPRPGPVAIMPGEG